MSCRANHEGHPLTDVDDQRVETFKPTSGRLGGVVTAGLAVLIAVIALVDGEGGLGPRFATGSILAAVTAWGAALYPALWVTESRLVMRNLLETVQIPLGAIESVVIRQVTAVRAGDERFVSSVIGRSFRDTRRLDRKRRDPRQSAPQPPSLPTVPAYADFVGERISNLAEGARARSGIRLPSEEHQALVRDVRRSPAWMVIVPLVVAALAFVGSFFL